MTNSNTVPSKQGLLERIATVSALATSFALAMSITYDWGFFSALGVTFASAPTSISDHIRTGLLWASRLIPGVLVLLVFDLLTRRLDHGLTEDEIIEASSDPERASKKMNFPRKLIAYSCLALLVLWLLTGLGPNPWLPAMICWMWFIMWVMKHPLVAARRSPMFWLFAFLAPPVLMYLFSAGHGHAKSAMADDFPVTAHVRYCEDGTESCPQTTTAAVLRTFQRWILVRDSATVYWIRSDHVERMDVAHENRSSFSGLMCIFFAKCLPAEKGPPVGHTSQRRTPR